MQSIRVNRTINLIRNKTFLRYLSKKISDCDSEVEAKHGWEWIKPEGHDTGIKIRNSYFCLCKSRNEFEKVPLIVKDPKHVTWYICGPTVYDSAHIGHALSYIRFDILRRVLTNYFGLNVCQVMGITDVDNKLSNRALLYDADIYKVGLFYTIEFKNEMQELNVLPPMMYMPITKIIPQIIHFITDILRNGRAYVAPQGDVYYDHAASPTPLNKLASTGNIFEEDELTFEGRRSKKDFLVWKASKAGEPYWDSPWGKGRPGWHIECSVAGSIAFGGCMDIHSGGFDLVHPHHEYELAQCEAFHQHHQWANYFLHTGQVRLRGSVKMSKSLGNAWNIEEALRSFHPWSLRVLALKTQFYQNVELHGQKLRQEANVIRRIIRFHHECDKYLYEISRGNVDEVDIEKSIAALEVDIMTSLKDNLNTQKAFQHLLCFMDSIIDKLSQARKSGSCQFEDIRNPTVIVKAKNEAMRHLYNFGFQSLREHPMKSNPLYDNIKNS